MTPSQSSAATGLGEVIVWRDHHAGPQPREICSRQALCGSHDLPLQVERGTHDGSAVEPHAAERQLSHVYMMPSPPR